MLKHLKEFTTYNEYNSYINSNEAVFPNTSHCVATDSMYYSPIDYSKEYLRTVALENGTISFNILQEMGTQYIASISYSTDNGKTWVTTDNGNNKQSNLVITVDVQEGSIILWKGNAQQTGYYNGSNHVGSYFSSTAEFSVSGNVMSLCYGDNFIGKDEIKKTNQFDFLFSDLGENPEIFPVVSHCKIVNAKDLYLPSTLMTSCYYGMFMGCSSLVTAPKLQATVLAAECYGYMFNCCYSLVTAPELPATTLADSCYKCMFCNCAFVKAPELPATTLIEGCYDQMFAGCNSLNYVKCLATVNASDSTTAWLANVSVTGTFIKDPAATWWTRDANGIPTGWTTEDTQCDPLLVYYRPQPN